MNLILLFEEDFISGTNHVRLSGRRVSHMKDVHRVKSGDVLTVGLLNGSVGTGQITLMNTGFVEMEVSFSDPPPKPLDLNLILALPRPKVINRLLLWSASLGIKKIWLINANRVEKSYWQSPRLSPENILEQSILGLEQAKDTIVPDIVLKPRFKPFVEDELPAIIRGTQPIVAHPHALHPCPSGMKGSVTLAIGPEGGFIPYEIDKLVECGFKPIRLGPRILRVETVLPYVLGKMGF